MARWCWDNISIFRAKTKVLYNRMVILIHYVLSPGRGLFVGTVFESIEKILFHNPPKRTFDCVGVSLETNLSEGGYMFIIE